MEKKVLIPLGAVIVILLVFGLFTQRFPNFRLSNASPKNQTQQKTATIKTKVVNLELANTEELRQKGLGGKSVFGNDTGMLFVFDEKPVTAKFWMKDMLIPIDIIWIKNGKIIKIDQNIPAPRKGTPDSDLKIYSPEEPIDYVLEVNSGFSVKNKFEVGDAVNLSGI
jgi:hypothetical protein